DDFSAPLRGMMLLVRNDARIQPSLLVMARRSGLSPGPACFSRTALGREPELFRLGLPRKAPWPPEAEAMQPKADGLQDRAVDPDRDKVPFLAVVELPRVHLDVNVDAGLIGVWDVHHIAGRRDRGWIASRDTGQRHSALLV